FGPSDTGQDRREGRWYDQANTTHTNREVPMNTRLQRVGLVLAIVGIVFAAGGAYAFMKTQEGYHSLNAFSAAQNVTLTYNDQGQLTSAGETAEADAIMAMLTKGWG